MSMNRILNLCSSKLSRGIEANSGYIYIHTCQCVYIYNAIYIIYVYIVYSIYTLYCIHNIYANLLLRALMVLQELWNPGKAGSNIN